MQLPAGAGRAALALFSVCGSTGDSRSHLIIPPWCPATLPLPRVFLSWFVFLQHLYPTCAEKSVALQKLLLFSSKRNGSFCFPPKETTPVFFQKQQLLFSSKSSSSCCSPSPRLAVGVQLSPQAASRAVSRGNSRRVSSGEQCLDRRSCRHFICSQEGPAERSLRVPHGRSLLSASS